MKLNFGFNIKLNMTSHSKKSLGIQFSKNYLKVAVLEKDKESMKLPIIPFKIEISGDPEEIGKLLREEIDRRDINAETIVAGLPYESILFRNIKLPKVKKEELEDAIKYNIKEDLKSVKGETYYDYTVLSEDEEGIQNILIVIAHRKDIDRIHDILKIANLNLDIIDTESTALINLAFLLQEKQEQKKEENVCVVHIEDDYSFIVFFHKGIITQSLNFNSKDYEKLTEDEKEVAVENLINEINYFFLTVHEPKIIYLSGNAFKHPEIKAYSQLKFGTRFELEELDPKNALKLEYNGNIPLGIFNSALALSYRGFIG